MLDYVETIVNACYTIIKKVKKFGDTIENFNS